MQLEHSSLQWTVTQVSRRSMRPPSVQGDWSATQTSASCAFGVLLHATTMTINAANLMRRAQPRARAQPARPLNNRIAPNTIGPHATMYVPPFGLDDALS